MTARNGQRGFSLLEILVAFAIAAMALGMLYRVSGNNARQIVELSGTERAMAFADSLLSSYQTVPPEGVYTQGQAAGYAWSVSSRPYPTAANDIDLTAVHLHELEVVVTWRNGQRDRSFQISSLRPERRVLPGEALIR